MKTVIRTWGNSLAVRIPKAFAMHLGISSGKEVDLSIEQGGLYLVSPTRKLEALLLQITPENLHGEIGTGVSRGQELW